MDHQYRKNGARNIYLNCNQMRLMLNALQINQKIYTLSTFPSSNRRNFEDSGIVLAVSVSQFYQSIAVHIQKPRLIRWLSLLYVYK